MQLSKINSVNFEAKNSQHIQKIVKPATEEFKADFSRFAYSVPTGNAIEQSKPAAQKAVQSAEYFYYGKPVEVLKEVKAANAADMYKKESEVIMPKETSGENFRFITDSTIL